MPIKDDYQQRCRCAHDAIDQVRDGDRIVVPTGVSEPPTLLKALSDRRREFKGVSVAQILPLAPYDYFDQETVAHVQHLGYFLGGGFPPGCAAGLDRHACQQLFRAAATHPARADAVGRRVQPRIVDGRPWLFLPEPWDRLHDGGRRESPSGCSRSQSQRPVRIRKLPRPHLAGGGHRRKRCAVA